MLRLSKKSNFSMMFYSFTEKRHSCQPPPPPPPKRTYDVSRRQNRYVRFPLVFSCRMFIFATKTCCFFFQQR